VTQTGGLVVLLAWIIFGAILALLAFFLLRPAKDPLDEVSAPTVDQPAAATGAAPAAEDRPGPGLAGPVLPED
jgi:hypothetical protein